jgi:Domain of unknown function (DUF932)
MISARMYCGTPRAVAESAGVPRFGDADTPIQARQLLFPRRPEDNRPDLWTVFNRVQENVIHGGLSAMGRDANNRLRRSGIDGEMRLNKALWTLADQMGKLKTGQPVDDVIDADFRVIN